MSATYRILPDRALVYVRYEGFVTLDESVAVIGEYIHDPQRRPGQMQLVDLSAVTGFEFDFVRLMALQAQKAAIFRPADGIQTLLVYYAPHDEGYEMAKLVLRSWQGVPSVMATIQRHESDALDILGQPERRMDELLSAAG
ncbi:hypothetical protein [Pararhodobacter zhoushanensis]|uniref:STAS/SEC14 domain-containing protein n=1 Tax=Pararhodobacter zhoushanensis TaxID=2479545 RepID=A0ABT3H187_9RHOB|nr:hypothetical protein [Pararhodobacter zhoushanensis]MCW1933526.1 hypothetical protein [Pararhodobacter zhoushanensis]